MPTLVPTCVCRARPELIVALDERFGAPVDAYVNGSQVWLRETGLRGPNATADLRGPNAMAGLRGPNALAGLRDPNAMAAPGGVTLEWRLHPVAGFRPPEGTGTYDLFEVTADALARGRPAPAPLERLWDGLEAFAAYGDEVEPATLAAACSDDLGLAPDAAGLVDHGRIGDEWERTGGKVSIVEALLSQLEP